MLEDVFGDLHKYDAVLEVILVEFLGSDPEDDVT